MLNTSINTCLRNTSTSLQVQLPQLFSSHVSVADDPRTQKGWLSHSGVVNAKITMGSLLLSFFNDEHEVGKNATLTVSRSGSAHATGVVALLLARVQQAAHNVQHRLHLRMRIMHNYACAFEHNRVHETQVKNEPFESERFVVTLRVVVCAQLPLSPALIDRRLFRVCPSLL